MRANTVLVRDWENTFRSWAKPPGITEATKCQNAERAIRKAIDASSDFAYRNIQVFPQGSYNNNTNVRLESDVDICLRCMDTFFFHDIFLPGGTNRYTLEIPLASYFYPDFKNDVENALVSRFGRHSVIRGNKAFDIHENTYRVDADAVACFEYRLYYRDTIGAVRYHSGTSFLSENGDLTINWPEQNYRNGVAKNDATGRRFKAIVRVLKNLRNEMEEAGVPAAKPIPSYFIECLVWNAPNFFFGNQNYVEDIRLVLSFLFQKLSSPNDCNTWTEVNGIKNLFFSGQPWTREQALAFVSAAWGYVGF